jgi:tetratricopeptide (TPR) repeat protein
MKWWHRIIGAWLVILGLLGLMVVLWHQATARTQQQGTAQAAEQPAGREASAPQAAQAYYQEAYACGARKDFAGAAQHFQQIVAEYPDSELADDAQYQRAICYFTQGDYERAIVEFAQVRAQFPDSYLAVRAEGWLEKAKVKQMAARGETWAPLAYADTVPAVPATASAAAPAEPEEIKRAEPAPLAYEQTAPAPPLPDCGPAALAIVCAELGVPADTEELAELAGTDATGTSLYGLQQAAAAQGLRAAGLQVDLAYLYQVEKPVLVWVGRNHYVVVTAVRPERVEFTDPDRGRLQMTVADFSKIWDGYILTVGREGKS